MWSEERELRGTSEWIFHPNFVIFHDFCRNTQWERCCFMLWTRGACTFFSTQTRASSSKNENKIISTSCSRINFENLLAIPSWNSVCIDRPTERGSKNGRETKSISWKIHECRVLNVKRDRRLHTTLKRQQSISVESTESFQIPVMSYDRQHNDSQRERERKIR